MCGKIVYRNVDLPQLDVDKVKAAFSSILSAKGTALKVTSTAVSKSTVRMSTTFQFTMQGDNAIQETDMTSTQTAIANAYRESHSTSKCTKLNDTCNSFHNLSMHMVFHTEKVN